MGKPVDFNERVFLAGKTRSGKTAMAQRLAASMTGTRRFVIDQKGRLDVGVAPVRGVERIDWSAPVVHYIPPLLTHDEYEALYEAIWHAGGPTLVWTDECRGPSEANWAPEKLRLIQQQGGELGFGHLACSQRPRHIAPELYTEAEHIFIFNPPPSARDLQVLADDIGISRDELAARMRALLAAEGKHSFLWYCRETDELLDCAPIPPEDVGLPLLPPGGHPQEP